MSDRPKLSQRSSLLLFDCWGLRRFDMAYALGRVPHEQRMATIELYGREVIRRVREQLTTGSHPWRRLVT
jgi:hypothetical protein